jgi:hypothetical protein
MNEPLDPFVPLGDLGECKPMPAVVQGRAELRQNLGYLFLIGVESPKRAIEMALDLFPVSLRSSTEFDEAVNSAYRATDRRLNREHSSALDFCRKQLLQRVSIDRADRNIETVIVGSWIGHRPLGTLSPPMPLWRRSRVETPSGIISINSSVPE